MEESADTESDGEEAIPHSDTAGMIKLLSDVAALDGPMPAKRRALMEGLSGLTEADGWGWIISRAEETHAAPSVGAFLFGGMDDRQVGRLVQTMQDRNYPPVEYAALNELRRKHNHFTRGWDELVTPEQWYGPGNRQVIDGLGFEHNLYSVRVLDGDGYFSGICLRRKKGRSNFARREKRIAHLITGLVDWLHWDPALAMVTREVQPLPPHLRSMLILMVDPRRSLQTVAGQLGIRLSTAKGYTKKLYGHFNVANRGELIGRFLIEGRAQPATGST